MTDAMLKPAPPKRPRGPPKNEDIWQYFTKLKDVGKYHNYWYIECKSCRNAYQMSGGQDSNVPPPAQLVSRIPEMRRHLVKCKYVVDYVPPEAAAVSASTSASVERPVKIPKTTDRGEKKLKAIDDKELRRRDLEHRWEMERRRMALEEQKNARIDQRIARQEEEAQINRRILLAKAHEAELQLKVAQAKARQELLQAGMTNEEIDVVLHRSAVNPVAVTPSSFV